MIFALLLSLILHVLLLFFVRFAPPSWKGLPGGTSPLSVILDTAPAAVVRPSAIAEASQNSRGTAKIGVLDNNSFPERPLAATESIPVEQPKTDIPKDFVGEEILSVKKSAQVNMVESAPDLLATKKPSPEKPEDKDKPYAPAPGVARPVKETPPTMEKLVSAEPTTGERQGKIVFAEPAQAKPPAENPENIALEPEPVKIAEPKPLKIEEQKPAEIENPKPAEAEKPQPLKTAEPAPEKIENPEHAQTEVTAETGTRPVETASPDVFRPAPPAYRIPSLAELSIASVRKFASDEDRKIKFGERRKTVGVREQDFRYAMYVEGVRLKLQRIGALNYPAEAARNNLSGTLSMLISIRADGSLEEFRVTQPSAYAVLDEGAERIIKMSAPFSPLPDNIRKDTDVLSIRINWTFSNSSQSFD